MVFKLLLFLFVLQSVQLIPAKHTYAGFTRKLPRLQRQSFATNGFSGTGFGQTGLGLQQQGFGGQQDNSQLLSGTTSGSLAAPQAFSAPQDNSQLLSGTSNGPLAGPQAFSAQQGNSQLLSGSTGNLLGGFGTTGFGQAQNQGLFNPSLGQGQNLGLGQTTGFGSSTGLGQSQNFGLGLNTQNQNSGFGTTAEQAYAQIDAELANIQAAGLGANQAFGGNQGLGANLNQGQGANLGQGLGTDFNQGLGLNQGLGSNQGLGLNQGLPSNLVQNLNSVFGQNQGQDLNQGFNQQTGANLQQFGGGQNLPPLNGANPTQPPLNPQIFTPASPDLSGSFGGDSTDQEKPIEIGGKPNKNINKYPQQGPIYPNNGDTEGPIVTKDFYLHAAPDDFDSDVELEKIKLGPSRKHYNVVFIKAPSLSPKSAALQLLQANSEEKTVIYVLNKQLDPAEIRANIKQLPNHVNKPEVFFIKYRTPEEAAFAQQKIQAQFDTLGGTSRVSDEGVSPITSVVGALQGQLEALQQQQQLPQEQQQQQFQQQQQQPQNGQQDQQQQLLQQQQFLQQQQQQQQQGQNFGNGNLNNGGGGFDNGQQQQQQQQQFQQGLNEGTDSRYNSGEGIIEPRIGPGKPVQLDGEAIGKTQNFGAAGQVDSRLSTRKLQPRKSKARH